MNILITDLLITVLRWMGLEYGRFGVWVWCSGWCRALSLLALLETSGRAPNLGAEINVLHR
jgi:hypothetical protein